MNWIKFMAVALITVCSLHTLSAQDQLEKKAKDATSMKKAPVVKKAKQLEKASKATGVRAKRAPMKSKSVERASKSPAADLLRSGPKDRLNKRAEAVTNGKLKKAATKGQRATGRAGMEGITAGRMKIMELRSKIKTSQSKLDAEMKAGKMTKQQYAEKMDKIKQAEGKVDELMAVLKAESAKLSATMRK